MKLSRSARGVPKEIALFGEKQFQETGANLVEVLRVKASTIRKHFQRIKGIAYLVAVVSLDRVRVYFFSTSGTMLVAENIEHEKYKKVRKTSRLLVKYEKPSPPTPEELRMEATEQLRMDVSRAIKRVARALAITEASFPDIYVTKLKLDSSGQKFGLLIEDGAYIIEEIALSSSWANGLIHRVAFLSHVGTGVVNTEIGQIVGNAVAYSLLKDEKDRSNFRTEWLKISKESELESLACHFIRHADAYDGHGFNMLIQLLQSSTPDADSESWISAIGVIHDSIEPSLGHDQGQTIRAFCKDLRKPYNLRKKQRTLESIHLSPRAIVNTNPLDITLSLEHVVGNSPLFDLWMDIELRIGNEEHHIIISESNGDRISSIQYILDIEDLFPKTGGLLSRGLSIIGWAKGFLGVTEDYNPTFSGKILYHDSSLLSSEKAVLERLAEGQLEILANSIVGSTEAITSLIKKEHLLFVPNFNHLGLTPNYYCTGDLETIESIITLRVPEMTLFESQGTGHAILSAPPTWRTMLFDYVKKTGLTIHPIISSKSKRSIIRSEQTYPSWSDVLTWSDGTITR